MQGIFLAVLSPNSTLGEPLKDNPAVLCNTFELSHDFQADHDWLRVLCPLPGSWVVLKIVCACHLGPMRKNSESLFPRARASQGRSE